MANLKLRVAKSGNINPKTKEKGFVARVLTNGKASVDEIAAMACRNTTVHKAEAKVALELCIDAVAEMLKQGYIVDLGPVGKLYPSCNSVWVEDAENLQLTSVKPSVYYRASDEVAAAIKGAALRWAQPNEGDEEPLDDENTPLDGSD